MISVIHLGASGAVGTEVLKSLQDNVDVSKYTLLGRRLLKDVPSNVAQKEISIFDVGSYEHTIEGHEIAICTLGVGEPSKISKDQFVRIDKQAVVEFAKECKKHGVKHFQLLASVGIDAKSSSFYLRTKGELVDALKGLNFEKLSIFMPSMILTPTNRYGFTQGLTLTLWPMLDKLFFGTASKYKGIKVEDLGASIAKNCFTPNRGIEYLQWSDFMELKTTSD